MLLFQKSTPHTSWLVLVAVAFVAFGSASVLVVFPVSSADMSRRAEMAVLLELVVLMRPVVVVDVVVVEVVVVVVVVVWVVVVGGWSAGRAGSHDFASLPSEALEHQPGTPQSTSKLA